MQDKIDKYFKEHVLPDYFYQCFFGELIKVFGIKGLIPDKYYDAEYDEGNLIESYCEDYSYRNQLDYHLTFICGTVGWNLALKEACEQCSLIGIYKDYSHFNWVERDTFDGYIEEEILNVIFSDDIENSYYKFKLNNE